MHIHIDIYIYVYTSNYVCEYVYTIILINKYLYIYISNCGNTWFLCGEIWTSFAKCLFCGNVYLLQCVASCCSMLQRVAARCQCLFMPRNVYIHTHISAKRAYISTKEACISAPKRDLYLYLCQRDIYLCHMAHIICERRKESEGETEFVGQVPRGWA